MSTFFVGGMEVHSLVPQSVLDTRRNEDIRVLEARDALAVDAEFAGLLAIEGSLADSKD